MEWISIADEIPQEGVQVLTIDARRPDMIEYALDYIIMFDGCEIPHIWACRLEHEMNFVTHWMPLPLPPKRTES